MRIVKKWVYRSFPFRWHAERKLASKTFSLNGRKYKYIVHPHGFTWTNERAVEIPIAQAALEENKGSAILEIGNVTSHYFTSSHTVVDKYEKAEGVINVDIIDYSPSTKYDFIVSISTLEHVGWDRDKKEAKKIPVAVNQLKQLLASPGKLLVTVPIGFNCFLDGMIADNALEFCSRHYLKRISQANEWEETDWSDVEKSKYGSPYSNANAIMMATYSKTE